MSDYHADKPASPLVPAESPAVTAHLNMLQTVITRLAGNSAQCKTWCVTLVSALFGLAGAVKNERIAAAAIIPIAIFGLVDAICRRDAAIGKNTHRRFSRSAMPGKARYDRPLRQEERSG